MSFVVRGFEASVQHSDCCATEDASTLMFGRLFEAKIRTTVIITRKQNTNTKSKVSLKLDQSVDSSRRSLILLQRREIRKTITLLLLFLLTVGFLPIEENP
jgi:hypothetical protein